VQHPRLPGGPDVAQPDGRWGPRDRRRPGELQTITAVILGGTSLFGGRGGVIGTLGGVVLLSLTANLLVVLNVNQWYQQLIQGVIIITAVALYKQKGRQ
jgi:ribose transport system permease protein